VHFEIGKILLITYLEDMSLQCLHRKKFRDFWDKFDPNGAKS